MRYHAKFTNYIVPPELPSYVEFVSKGRHPANHVHDHNFTEVVLVLSGEGTYLLEDAQRKISAGDLLIVPTGLNHGYDHVETLELVNLTYKIDELHLPLLDACELPLFELFFPPGGRWQDPDFFLDPVLHLTAKEVKAMSKKLQNLESFLLSSGKGHCFKALGMFIEIIASFAEKENNNMTSGPDFGGFSVIHNLMQKELHRNISVAELARGVHMSERTFLRHFKKAVGIPPMEYLNLLRLQHGAKLLYDTSFSISEIAEQCGFCDSSHFSTRFKAHYGIPPKTYRLQRRTSSARETLPKGALT